MWLNKQDYANFEEKTVKFFDEKDDILLDEPDIGASKYNFDVEMNTRNKK